MLARRILTPCRLRVFVRIPGLGTDISPFRRVTLDVLRWRGVMAGVVADGK